MTASATQRARSAKVVEPPEDGFDADGLPGAADTAGSIRSLWYLCPLVVTWAIVVGALAVAAPVFAAWLSSSAWEQGVAGPLRLSVLGWVVIHDVPVRVDGASYSLMPWGLAGVPFALLWLGGRWAGRVSQIIEVRATLALVGWTAALYAATIGIATWVVSAPDLRLSAPRAFCTAFTLAFAAIALGVYRGTLAGSGSGAKCRMLPGWSWAPRLVRWWPCSRWAARSRPPASSGTSPQPSPSASPSRLARSAGSCCWSSGSDTCR